MAALLLSCICSGHVVYLHFKIDVTFSQRPLEDDPRVRKVNTTKTV